MPVSNQVRESVVKGTKLCIRKECRTINSRNFPQVLHRNKQRKTLWNQSISEGFGPSGAIRTLGPVNPNHVRYQLRYTRIFNCHNYTTARAKIKVFPVCSHLCGQSGFWPGFAARKNPANDRVARGSGLWLFLSWIDGESLPNQVPNR